MNITPDQFVIWQWGPVTLNATILYTWLVILLLAVGSWLITRRLSTSTTMSHWQNLLEVIVGHMRDQIREITQDDPGKYMWFVGTLFVYILTCNILAVVPGFLPPTGSLSTTAGLALCVFVAVPAYGIAEQGFTEYLKNYIRPTPFMLPFNILGELSRTFALAVRLFGNMMSGTMIVAILLVVIPFLFPVAMQALSLLTGVVQAYIFAVLAIVYIAGGTRAHRERQEQPAQQAEIQGSSTDE